MKKRLTTATLSIVSLALAHSAYADNPFLLTLGDDYYVFSADAGYGELTTPSTGVTPGASVSRDSLVWSLGAGYAYALDSFSTIGIEGDYLQNGQASYGDHATIQSYAFSILGTFDTMWANGVNVFIKGGVADVFQSSGSSSAKAFEPEGVIGVGYFVMPNLNIFTDFTYMGGHSESDWTRADDKVASSMQLKVGASYQF